MPENSSDKKIFSLLEVTLSIQKTLSERYKSSFWVKAEMNKLQYYPHSGHCYPELVEKKDGKVIAQVRANLWRDDYLRVNNNFQQVLKEPLKDGIKILFCAKIVFDPTHGIALRILDIDPGFSLGELEREKQETIENLKKAGIYHKNKEKKLPLLPQRIAIISVQTSKGYADFLKVIEENSWGYKFFHLLFPSLLQGEKAVDSIRMQLNRIKKIITHFDVVAIVRGGGGDIGLSCFNNLALAKEIAQFPIPVITGIGHATNETVVEMISFKNAITPTELADYLLQKFHDFSMPVLQAEDKLNNNARRILKAERIRFAAITKYFRSVAGSKLAKNKHEIENLSRVMLKRSRSLIRRERDAQALILRNLKREVLTFCNSNNKVLNVTKDCLFERIAHHTARQRELIANLARIITNMDPINVLKRGYSITMVNGKALKNSGQVKAGDIMDTLLHDGKIISKTLSVVKPGNEHE